MSRRRIVVTGMGAVTPFGVTVDRLWDGVLDGRSAISLNTQFDTALFDVKIGGQIPNYEPTDYLDRKLIKRMDPFTQLAMVATDEAIRDCGIDLDKQRRDRVAVIYGTGIGGLNELEQQYTRLTQRGPSKVSAFTIPKLMVNAAAGNISIAYGLTAMSVAVSSACASATNAMGTAMHYVQSGMADVAITGGSEAALTPLAVSAFASMKALSRRNDNPTCASRPFDRDRDGFVLSEGAGTLVFEELEHAKARGAPILAEVIGFGCTSDALHIAQPSEDGLGAANAMRYALQDGQVNPEEVDYINAHATSTPLGDVSETKAIKAVFGPHANKLVISSTKGSIGHCLGASGGIEMIATIRALQQAVVPPTVNLEEPGEGCDLDYCPKTPRDRKLRIALNNSFGFGGHNAAILVRKFE